jgi:hypothetical protein
MSCPLGGSCEGNIVWEEVQPKYGWWRVHDIIPNNKKHPPHCLAIPKNMKQAQPKCAFQKCFYPHACLGSANPGVYDLANTTSSELYDPALHKRNESCDAAQGYSNTCQDENGEPARCRLCGTCIGSTGRVGEKRYKRTGSGTKCKLCPDPTTNKILLGVGFVVMLIGSAVMIYMEITSETSEDETSDAIKKIIVNFLQMVSLAGGLPLEWPDAMNLMFDSFSTLSSAGTTLMIPDCELTELRTADAFYLKQIFYTFSVPIVIFACIVVWTFLRSCCEKRMKLNWSKTKDYTILSIVLMLFLCYPMLVRLSLSMLKCPFVGDQAYLMADLQERCFTGRHLQHILWLTVPQLILYVFGLPFIATMIILRNKQHLHHKKFYTRYGLLYMGYRENREWWELIIAFRKVTVVAIGTFGTLMGVIDLQAFIALGIVFLSIVIHLIGQPFNREKPNGERLHQLEFQALTICWFTFCKFSRGNHSECQAVFMFDTE